MIQNTNYGASKTYVNTKVDKLTTSGLKAYTHDGATQGEIDVSNTYTPATLALRDANGRMQAADPASGATDKTLVTANWISQTGSGRPNNVLHNSGNETKAGDLQMSQSLIMTQFGLNGAIKLKTPADRTNFNTIFGDMLNWDDKNGDRIVSVRFSQSANGTIRIEWLFHKPDGTQISIGSFGMDVNGNPVTTGIFA